MREIEMKLPSQAVKYDVIRAVDSTCHETDLTLVSKSSLGKYPGCVHWHFKQADQPGTLEITYWPSAKRLWFSLRANRYAEWMDAAVPHLRADIERWLIANSSKVAV